MGCFIATASYEASRLAAAGTVEVKGIGPCRITPDRLGKLNSIRRLRDLLLQRVSAGRAFSAWYYAVGPYAADAIRENEPVKSAIRQVLLDPLAELSRSCTEAAK